MMTRAVAERPESALERRMQRLAGWPDWRRDLTIGLGAAAVALLFFAPRYWLWPLVGLPLEDFISRQPEFHRAFFALAQLRDPWAPIESVVNRVIEWRLLFPLLAHTLHLPPAAYLALPAVGVVVTLGVIAHHAWRLTAAVLPTLSVTVLAATTSWFFVATGWLAYFDAWLVLALVLTTLARSGWTVFAASLLAPWIDERFLLAVPLCVALRAEQDGVLDWRRVAGLVAAGVLPYVLTRLAAEMFDWRSTTRAYWSDRSLLPSTPLAIAWGAWSGLRLAWIPVALAVAALVNRGRWLTLGLAASTLVINLLVADDLSRSTSVLLPLVLAGALGLVSGRERMRRWLPWLAIGNLLLPAEHVIASDGAIDGVRVFRVPILSLAAERARAEDPPYFASPFAYNRRGMDAFTAGNRDAARRAFAIALRLDPEFPRTHANLAILQILEGDREGGLQRLDDALARAPWMYEVRLQRAGFRHQAGDTRGALEDLQQVLRFAPPDWPRRAEVEQFAATLSR